MADFKDLRNRVFYGVILAAVGVACLSYVATAVLFILIIAAIVFGEVVNNIVDCTVDKKRVTPLSLNYAYFFLGVSMLGFLSALLMRFDGLSIGWSSLFTFWGDGFWSLVLIALCVVATDIFAYVGGKFLGRTPFFPNISPKKTWEGTAIGVASGATIFILAWLIMDSRAVVDISAMAGALLAVCMPAVAVSGDLLESKAKRTLHIKDFGTMLGEHGGVADRFDAMTACLLFYFVIVSIAS